MTTRQSVLRKASALIEALETRTFFSGELDRSFGYRGQPVMPDHVGPIQAVAVQADGKVVVAGKAVGSNAAYVARYTVAGALDPTFGTSGVTTVTGVNGSALDGVTVLSSGNILLGGTVYARLTSAGKLDKTYGGGDGLAPSNLAADRRAVQDAYVFADGSFLELGNRATNKKNYVFKHKADGSIDTTFGSAGGFNVGSLGADQTGAVAADPQGRVYVSYGISGALHVVRLTAAGKVDTTYGTKGVASGDGGTLASISAMGVLSDGRTIVAFEQESGYGARDINLFDATGKWIENKPAGLFAGGVDVHQITQAKDGTVFLSGDYYDGEASNDGENNVPVFGYTATAHLNKDLSLDTKYSSNLDGVGGFATGGFSEGTAERYVAAAVTASGQVILVGMDSLGHTDIARLTADTEANGISFTRSAASIVVSGRATGDYMTVDDFARPQGSAIDRVIQLDNSGGLTSADRVVIKNVTAAFKTTLNLNGGDDQVYANEKFGFTVNGGAGNDYISTEAANSVQNGGDGNDSLRADGEHSVLHGDAGNDDISLRTNSTAYGDDGNDSLFTFDGGTLAGGAGDDVFYHSYGTLVTTLDGGTGRDTAYSTIDDIYKSIEVYAQTTPHGT